MSRVIQGVFFSRASYALARQTMQRKSGIGLAPGVEVFPVNLARPAGGLPLPREVQAKLGAALAADFSDVRVHVGSHAASIGAIAFTWGTDIHFAPGQYNPHTQHGQMVLAHELVHVIQQRAGRVRNPLGNGVAVVQDPGLEAEADRLGRKAVLDGAAKPHPAPAPAVFRAKPVFAAQGPSRPAMQPMPAPGSAPLAFRYAPPVPMLPPPPPRPAGGRYSFAVQRVMAYRVEYPESYKVNMDASNNITGFGNDDGYGISISFVKPDHSEHFVEERHADQLQGLRVVSWEFSDDWHAAILAKAEGRGPSGLNQKQKNHYEKIKNLKGPSWSDGANLDKFTKKNALSFNSPDWFPHLLKASKGKKATVEYPDVSAKQTPAPKVFVSQAELSGNVTGWAWFDDETEGFDATRREAEAMGANWRAV